jgi:type I restriction-modification system DNA methylase subunit
MKKQPINGIIKKTLQEIYKYLNNNFSKLEMENINKELVNIVEFNPSEYTHIIGTYSYIEMQNVLSTLNEKGLNRKSKGVYYTPNDVVSFIFSNAVKSLYGIIKKSNLHVQDLNGVPYKSFCYEKSVFDPTCGAGEFLLVALATKLDLVDLHQTDVTNIDICRIVHTIHGNDINEDSTTITKFRIFIYLLNRYGSEKICGFSKELHRNFTNIDFINLDEKFNTKYDIIIGNPPYVEDSKSETVPVLRYGNVYANVLDNSANCLATNGVMGYIIPLSYISTPRMKKIRNILINKLSEQYILSYCDRPDCLFPSVHQKLSILIAKHKELNTESKIFTGNYQFWYKEERDDLFKKVPAILNRFTKEEYIPKLGSAYDQQIYRKVTGNQTTLFGTLNEGDVPLYLNMRAAFWIKAFREEHNTSEYKKYGCLSKESANLSFCILNSSLFWWYWISVSDCWHITNKELKGFTIPKINDFKKVNLLAKKLENKLEKTKQYVGTKQTEYEYKHKDCIDEIHEIDDLVCQLYGLSEEEKIHIKNFAFRYRVGGGALSESN